MDRIQLVNTLIETHGYTRYLEIGVKKGDCFEQIKARYKTGVDPELKHLKKRYKHSIADKLKNTFNSTHWTYESEHVNLHELTSDDFFANPGETYDLVFIDGLHQFDQVLKDYTNAQRRLNPGGCIVMHDCNPLTEQSAERIRSKETKVWNGDTWKAIYHLRKAGQNIDVLDFDHGCGVAFKQDIAENIWTDSDVEQLKQLPFATLEADRRAAVGLCSWDEYRQTLPDRQAG